MIIAILPYVGSYDDVRAACGMSEIELTDEELALQTYVNILGVALDATSGIYPPAVTEQTLQEMFDTLPATDPMKAAIQQYSVCVVAHAVCGSVGLKAAKTITDGKASLTRFSAESTFKDTLDHTGECMAKWMGIIRTFLGETLEVDAQFTVVKPAYDPVTGE